MNKLEWTGTRQIYKSDELKIIDESYFAGNIKVYLYVIETKKAIIYLYDDFLFYIGIYYEGEQSFSEDEVTLNIGKSFFFDDSGEINEEKILKKINNIKSLIPFS